MNRALQVALLLVLGQGAQTFGGQIGSVSVSTVAIFGALALAIVAISVRRRPEFDRARSTAHPLFWLAALPILGVTRAVAGTDAPATAVLPLLTYAAVGLAAYLLARLDPTKLESVAALVLAIHVALSAVESIRRESLFYGSWKLAEAQTYGGFQRVASTTADPNYLALSIVLIFPLAWRWLERRSRGLRWGFLIASALTLGFTFSRALFVGIAIALILSLLDTRHRKAALRAALAAGTALALVGVTAPGFWDGLRSRLLSILSTGTDASADQRFVIQKIALRAAQEDMFFGNGAGSGSAVMRPLTSYLVPPDLHGRDAFLAQTSVLNSYLTTWLELGLIGLVLFAGILVVVLRACWNDPVWRYAFVVSAVMMLALDALTLAPLWLFVGAGLAMPLHLEPERRRECSRAQNKPTLARRNRASVPLRPS